MRNLSIGDAHLHFLVVCRSWAKPHGDQRIERLLEAVVRKPLSDSPNNGPLLGSPLTLGQPDQSLKSLVSVWIESPPSQRPEVTDLPLIKQTRVVLHALIASGPFDLHFTGLPV